MLHRAKSLLSTPVPSGTETIAVKHDRWDHEEWTDVKEASPAIGSVLEDLGQTFDYTEDLLEGMFDYLIKAEPEVVAREDMVASRKPNQAITIQSKDTPQTAELRQYTKSDPYSAAMGVVAISEKVKEYLQENKDLAEKAKQAQEEREKREQAEQDAADALAEAQQAAGDYEGEGPQTPDQAAAEAALQAALDALEAQQQAEQAAGDALDQSIGQHAPGTRQAVREGVNEATEEAREEAAAMAAAGVDPGEAKHMPWDQRAALAQMLANKRLRQIAPLLGRFRMENKAEQAKRVEHGRDVFVDVEQGRDLSRALGSEIAKMAGGPRMLRLDTLRRFSEGKLLLRKFEGTEKVGKGTVVAVVDTSGSMMTNIGGAKIDNEKAIDPSRDAWAKAITFCLLDNARRQHRDFYAILFSNGNQQRHYSFPANGEPRIFAADGTTEIPVTVPKGSTREMVVTIDLITFMFNGGTNFENPLTQALRVIEKNFDGNGKSKADIAFITDDDGTVSEKFMADYLRVKDKVGVRTFGFAVGCHAGNTLTAVSDNVRSLTDLAQTDEVRDVFRSI